MGQRMLASAEWLLLAVALVWGTSYGVAKLALEHYPVFGVLAVRFILAGLCLLPALRAIRWQAWRAGLPMGGILLAILLCETWALQYTSASNAAFLISLCLVLTPLAEWLLYGQRPAARIWALVGLSWLGALLLTGDSAMHFSGGDALMLLAAVLRAFGVCWLKQLADRQPATAQALTAMQCWTVGLGALALSASQGGLPPLPRDPRLLAGHQLPGRAVHRLRLCHPELRPAPQRPQPRRPADGQRTGVRRAIRLAVAG